MDVILAVDDEVSNLEVLIELLSEDYEVLLATSGRQGIELARTHQPDLILLDIRMPEIDGYEVYRSLCQDPRTEDIPVIFISAMREEEHQVSGLTLGAVDYVTKPFVPAILHLRVQNFLKYKKLHDFYRNLSTRDGLTGLANRRRFDQELGQVVVSGAEQGPFSLILADIDHFKPYNDSYGHLAGDDCLRRIATALDETGKAASGLVARYGGEEFACILAATGHKKALLTAGRLRTAVNDLAIPHIASETEAHVTVSLGCLTVPPEASMPSLAVIRQADRLLYRAKELGRNRIVAAVGPADVPAEATDLLEASDDLVATET